MVLICKTLSPLSPKDALCQVWPSGSGEKECYTWLMHLHYLLFPLEKRYWKKIEISSSKNTVFQVWLKSLVVLEIRIINIFKIYFRNFVKICSRKRMALHLNKIESPLTKKLALASCFRERWKRWNVYWQTTERTDDMRSEKLTS